MKVSKLKFFCFFIFGSLSVFLAFVFRGAIVEAVNNSFYQKNKNEMAVYLTLYPFLIERFEGCKIEVMYLHAGLSKAHELKKGSCRAMTELMDKLDELGPGAHLGEDKLRAYWLVDRYWPSEYERISLLRNNAVNHNLFVSKSGDVIAPEFRTYFFKYLMENQYRCFCLSESAYER